MNRKIDDIIGQKKEKRNTQYVTLITILMICTIFGLIFLSTFIGFVYQNYISGQAGYIYEVVLDYRQCAYLWSGTFGAAVMVPGYTNPQDAQVSSCGMYDTNLLFSCLQSGTNHIVMASQVPSSSIDWSSIQAADTGDVDTYLDVTQNNLMSGTRTFTQAITYQIGGRQYFVPGTYTNKGNGTNSENFDMGILKDSNGNIIYITHILNNFTRGFNGRVYNYQMILPIRNGTNPDYFFFTDPNYVCPQGQGQLPNPGNVEGTVTTNSGQKLEGVIVDVAGVTTLTDANGFYNLSVPSGTYNLFGVKTGYQAYVGNVTIIESNTTKSDFVMVLEAIPNQNTGPGKGPGVSTSSAQNNNPGKGIGPGEAPLVPIIEQPKRIEGIDYVISLAKIDRKIVLGNFLQEFLSFYSYKKSSSFINFSIEGENLSKIVKLDKASMNLEPNTNDKLTLTIFGEGDLGTYNGSLVIDGDIKEKVPITIEILSKTTLPVETLFMTVDIPNRNIFASDQMQFTVNLHNLVTDQSYPVSLKYTIQNEKGDTLWSDTSNVYLQTSFSLVKSASLPNNIPTGNYILRITANYLGLSSGASSTFSVVLPFYQRVIFGLKVWLWMVIVASLLILAGSYFFIKRYIQSKKRYSAKVEYSELPKVGPKAAFVGKIAETEHKTYFDLEQFKVHTIVAGATGGGKSVAAQVVVEEALLKNVAVIVFDPTAQWS